MDALIITTFMIVIFGIGYTAGHSFTMWHLRGAMDSLRTENHRLREALAASHLARRRPREDRDG